MSLPVTLTRSRCEGTGGRPGELRALELLTRAMHESTGVPAETALHAFIILRMLQEDWTTKMYAHLRLLKACARNYRAQSPSKISGVRRQASSWLSAPRRRIALLAGVSSAARPRYGQLWQLCLSCCTNGKVRRNTSTIAVYESQETIFRFSQRGQAWVGTRQPRRSNSVRRAFDSCRVGSPQRSDWTSGYQAVVVSMTMYHFLLQCAFGSPHTIPQGWIIFHS